MAKQLTAAEKKEREASLMLVTGMKGVGKTFLTLFLINKYIQDTASRKGRKVLIFDANGEYTQFKRLALEDVGRFAQQQKIEVRRIMPLNPDGSPMGVKEMVKTMGYIMENYRGGLLLTDILPALRVMSWFLLLLPTGTRAWILLCTCKVYVE
jgi:Mrp family chromosome partitioning ATPase